MCGSAIDERWLLFRAGCMTLKSPISGNSRLLQVLREYTLIAYETTADFGSTLPLS